MTGVKISTLPAASAAGVSDQIEVNQGGTSRRVTLEQVRDLIEPVEPDETGEPDSILDYGAVGDGVTDDTAAIVAALAAAAASGAHLTGNGKTYAVSGNIVLPDRCWLQDAKFKQLSPEATNRRTLRGDSYVTGITLIRVSVNRNGTPTSVSTMADAAGIYVSGNAGRTASVHLEDVEVYGDGCGKGLFVSDFDTVTMVRPHVHDMAWYDPIDPGSGGEKILGIGTVRVDKVNIHEPQIHRLMGWWGTTHLRAYQTDGLGISGASSALVIGGKISFCGEGFDGSGSASSTNVWFYDTIFEDCGAAWKAGSHRDSGAVGCAFIRPQLWGAVTGSSPLATQATTPRNLQLASCYTVDCGASHDYAVGSTAGYRVDWNGVVDPALIPKGIRFDNCSAVAHTATATGSISGTVLTVTNTAEGMVVMGQNVAGAGVTASTYIAASGRSASIIGAITGSNNLVVSTTHYGEITVGQKVYGPGIRSGITILSGAGANWVLSNNPVTEPLPSIASVAMKLTLATPNVYTVTPSQVVGSTTLTMTGNMGIGFQIQPELVNEVTVNNGVVAGATVADFYNFTKRASSWRSDGMDMILGGVHVPAEAGAFPSTTRYAQYLSSGPLVRRDDNGLAQLSRTQNFGITGTNQGAQWNVEFGTATLFEANAAAVDTVTTGTWGAVVADRTAKLRFRVANGAGGLSNVMELQSPTSVFYTPLNFINAGSFPTSNADQGIGGGSAAQAFVKATNVANFGFYYGNGAPTFSAAKGSLYTNATATTTTTRLYVNTDGGTTWANFTSSA